MRRLQGICSEGGAIPIPNWGLLKPQLGSNFLFNIRILLQLTGFYFLRSRCRRLQLAGVQLTNFRNQAFEAKVTGYVFMARHGESCRKFLVIE